MKNTIFFSALLIMSMFATTSALAQDDWKFLGDKTVNYGVDRDVIRFGDLGDAYRQIRFHVTDAPVRIFDVKIYFDNGDVQDVSLRSVIPQGGNSRAIDLVGGTRHLTKIEFWYKPAARGRFGQSRVAVWGKK
jgi:hypothetical protein